MVAAIIIMITTDADDDDDIDSDDGKEEVRTKITKMLSMLLDRFLMGLIEKEWMFCSSSILFSWGSTMSSSPFFISFADFPNYQFAFDSQLFVGGAENVCCNIEVSKKTFCQNFFLNFTFCQNFFLISNGKFKFLL